MGFIGILNKPLAMKKCPRRIRGLHLKRVKE